MMDGSNFGGPPSDDDPTASPRAGLRWETVQHLYSINTNSSPPNNLLLVGEIGLELADPVKIWAGVPIDMDPTGRKLLYDSTGVSASLPEAPTDGFIYGREGSNKSWQAVLPLYGGTLTGPLTIQSLTDATLHLEATGQSWAALTFNTPRNDTVSGYIEARRYGYPRWSIELGNRDLEAGANSGSNFVINRYNDTPGNLIFPTAFKIDRNFGYAHFGSLVFLAVDPNTDLEAATKHYVDINSGKGVYLPLLGGTINPGPLNIESDYQTPALNLSGIAGIGVYTPIITMDVEGRGAATGIIQTKRSGFMRWQMTLGDGFTDESGFSVGTDFILSRFDDIGGLLSNVLTIERGTGDTVLAANINIEGYVTLSAGDPQHALEAATKNYVDTQIAKGQYLPLTGGNLTGPLSINPTGFNYPPRPGDQPLLTLVWTVGTGSINVGEFIVSAGGGEPGVTGVAAQGSMSSPVQVAFHQTLLRLAGRGHDGVAWTDDAALITLRAAEQWTAASHGTYLLFDVTRKGLLTPSGTQSMVLASSGNLILGANDPAFDDITHRLQVNGAATFTGSVDLQYYPTGATQAASKEYVDDQVKVVTGYLPLTGGQLSGGLSFGQRMAPGSPPNPWDTTQHISLFDGWGGFSITANRLNIVHNGEAWFIHGTTDIARFTNVGLWFNPTYTIVLGRDPAFPYEAATMQWVTAQVATGAFLPITGGTLTGNLAIDRTAALQPANLYLLGAVGYGAQLAYFSGHSLRWSAALDQFPEDPLTTPMSNAGSNYAIYSFQDDGSFLGTPFQIYRASGYVVVANTIQVGRLPSQAMEVATMGYVDIAITAVKGAYLPLTAGPSYPLTGQLTISTDAVTPANVYLISAGSNASVFLDKGATSGFTNQITGRMLGLRRWQMHLGGSDAESGGNQGSSFSLYSFTDAGTAPAVVMSISRQTGTVTIPNPLMLGGPPTAPNQAATMKYVTDTIAGGAFLPLAGGIMQGGISWADVWGQSPSDATHHIILHSGFGIGIYGPISPRMNFIAGATGTHAFISGQDILYINSAGLTMASNTVDVILTRVPTNSMGAVPRSYADLMLPLAGGTMTGGLIFNNANYNPVAGRPDLRNHIQLFAGYGFSITAGSLNIVTGGATWFSNSSTGQDIAFFADATVGLQMIGLRTVNLGRDPSDKMDAVTKQYADGLIGAAGGPFLPISAGVGNALQGRLYLTANVLPLDDWEAPPKKYVDTADQNLQSQISAVVSGNLVFYGQLDVAHDVVHYKYTVNLPDTPMPLPTAVPKGGYIIVTVGGIPPTGTGTNIPPLPLGTPQYVRGDWFISDGEIWIFLPTGLVYFTADAVIVSPPIQGTINVQATLQWLSDNKLNLAGGTMQGPLYLATQPTTGSAAVRRDYLTSQLGGYLALTGGQMSGGITFGQNAGLSPPDTSKHITLWEQSPGAGGYGIGVSSYRLNYMTNDILSYHVTMVAGVDIVRVDNTGLRMQGATDIYIPRLPTSGSHAANRDYVDSRTPLAVDAPNDAYWYARHGGVWAGVPGATYIGAGALDLNTIPLSQYGVYLITNQTAAPNWPADNLDQCAYLLQGWNSNGAWQTQLMMGGRQRGTMPALWYRSVDDEYAGGWSPWNRLMADTGGAFKGPVTFGAQVGIYTGAALGVVPLIISANGNNVVPTPAWNAGFSFNLSSGGSEFDFINNFPTCARSFSWWQVDSSTVMRQLGWFSPNGDLSVSGQVYLLGGAQSSPTQAASVGYVNARDPTGKYLLLTGGTLTGLLTINAPATFDDGGYELGLTIGSVNAFAPALLFSNFYPSSFLISLWTNVLYFSTATATNWVKDVVAFGPTAATFYTPAIFSDTVTLGKAPSSAMHAATMQYVDTLRTFVTTNYLPLTAGQSYTITGPLWVDNIVHIIGNTQVVPAQIGGSFISWNFSGGSGEVNFWNGGGGGDPGFDFRRVTGSGTSFQMAYLDSGGNLRIAGALNIGAGQPSFGYQAANKDYVDAVRTLVTSNYLPLAGGTMQGGINMNSLATLQTDIMRGLVILDLGATNRFGFNVSFDGVGGHPAHLNYVVETNAVHSFLVNHVSIADIHGGGIDVKQGYLSLANDPTSNMHAVTLQYLNSQIAAGVRSFNTRTGFVTLTSLDVTNALTYTPVNRAGDTMTGALFVQVTPTTTTAQLDIGPPFGVGNSLEGKLRFRGTFGGTISDIGPRFTASLRSGYAGASAWGGEYLDVWMANGNPNDANSDINQVQVLRFLRNGINMPANMHIYLASDPTSPLEAATMQYADGVITRAGGPFLPTAGGTVTGNLLVDGVFYNDANRSSAGIVGGFGLALVNNVTQSEGEVDFVSRYIPYGGFRWYQIQTGNVFAPLMTLRPYGVLDLFSTGITYQGITHGGNAIAWAMYNNTVEAYVDGNFIGGLLTTAGGTLTGDLFIANNHKLGLLDAGGGQVYFTIGADNHFGFYSTAQNGATSVRVWDFYVRTDVSSQYFGLPTEFGSIVTIDGQLYVKGANPQLNIQGPAGTWRTIQFYSGASNRWNIQLDPNTESGNNVGSDLRFTSWSDAGGVLGVPLMIGRGTGKVTISSIASNDPLELVAPNGNWARIFSTVTGTRTWAFGTRNDGVFCISDENLQVFRLLIDSAGAASFGASVNISNAGGLHFGNKLAPTGPQDTSQHITLWDGGYGFSITGGTLNYTTGGAHDFYAGGLSARITGAGVWAFVPLTLAADPTTAMHAATKQYVDNNFTAIAAGGIHPSWLHVSGNTASYIPQGGYMMWNRAGGGLTNFVNNRGLGSGGFSFTDSNGTTDIPLLTLLPNAATLSVGLNFGSVRSGSDTDLSHHISIYPGYGFSATNTRMNYVVDSSSSHVFYVGATMMLYVNVGGMSISSGPLTLAVDPTAAMHAVTRQWAVANLAPISGAGYVSKGGDTMSGALTIRTQPYPSLMFTSFGNAADNKSVQQYVDTDGSFCIQFLNDAFNVGGRFFQTTRSGATPGTTTITGALIVTSGVNVGDFYSVGNVNTGAVYLRNPLGILYQQSGNWISYSWDGSWVRVYIDSGFQYQLASIPWVQNNFKSIGAYTPNQAVDYRSSPTFWDLYSDGTFHATNAGASNTFAGPLAANNGFTTNYLVVNGDAYENNIYVRGGLGLNFQGVYNSGVWYAFGWDGHLNIAINGGGQGQLAYVGDLGAYATYDWVNQNFQIFSGYSGWGFTYAWGGTKIGFEWNGSYLFFHLDGGGGIPLANLYSDRRAKYDIAPSKLNCLAIVNALPVSEFRWRPRHKAWEPNDPKWRPPDDDDTPLVRVGIIAQDWLEVFPESVGGTKGRGEAPLATEANVILAALVGSVQQLTAQNTALMERIEALEARTLH